MDYFKCLNKTVDISPFLKELSNNEEAWLVDTRRQEQVKEQRETQNIVLRSAANRKDLHIMENQESYWTSLSEKFSSINDFMTMIAEKLNGSLSRASIVRLKPGGAVYPHIDFGSYYFIRDRYHLILESKAGSIMMSGGETVCMQEGELWWFENNQHHQAINNSDEWRTHLIFDILPDKYKELGKNPLTPDEIKARIKKAKEQKQKPESV